MVWITLIRALVKKQCCKTAWTFTHRRYGDDKGSRARDKVNGLGGKYLFCCHGSSWNWWEGRYHHKNEAYVSKVALA